MATLSGATGTTIALTGRGEVTTRSQLVELASHDDAERIEFER